MNEWNIPDTTERLDEVRVGTSLVRPGDRVRLCPRVRADIMDLVLTGKIASVVSIEQDFEGNPYVAVTVDEDPGKDFGEQLQPGHRFFFFPEEIEPCDQGAQRP
jgi:hypothetical protein